LNDPVFERGEFDLDYLPALMQRRRDVAATEIEHSRG
jgi:hypothetical protein